MQKAFGAIGDVLKDDGVVECTVAERLRVWDIRTPLQATTNSTNDKAVALRAMYPMRVPSLYALMPCLSGIMVGFIG